MIKAYKFLKLFLIYIFIYILLYENYNIRKFSSLKLEKKIFLFYKG